MGEFLFADGFACTGCRICEIVCSFTKEGVINPALARIKVVREEHGVDKPISCRHCARPKCVAVCAEKAIIIDRGRVTVIAEKCNGCWECIEACPMGAMVPLPYKKIVANCDVCGECVKFCPPGVLHITDADKLGAQKRRALTRAMEEHKKVG